MTVQGTADRALGVLRRRGPFRLDADPHGPLPAEPPPTLTEEGRRRAVRRFRTFAGIFLVYLGYPVHDLVRYHAPPAVAAGLVLMAAFVWVYLGPLPVGMFDRVPGAARWVPAAMAAIMLAYLLVAGRGGLVFVTYLCVALVVLLRPVVSAPLVALVCAATVLLPQYVERWDVRGLQWSLGGPALLIAIVMYAVRANSDSQIALYQARAEVERLAAEQERLRISRDLHDLLGHALTTVVVKSDLAARLATRDPERAAAEMAEVAGLSRQALADVRAAVAGYRETSLAAELATAREVLRAAGIQAELPPSVEAVPGELRELFGWVLREGVTNAVRHSRASHLRVRLLDRAIVVEDDGVGAWADDPTRAYRRDTPGGTGLTGLNERVAAAGGRLTVGPAHGHGWRLCVEVPR